MNLDRDTLKKLLGLVAFGVLLHWGLQNLSLLREGVGFLLELTAPFLLGCCIAFILNVPMSAIERRLPRGDAARRRGRAWGKLRRPLALVLTLLCVAAVLVVGGAVVVPEISSSVIALAASLRAFPATLARWAEELTPFLPQLGEWLAGLQLNWRDILAQALEFFRSGAGQFLGSAWNVAAGVFSGLFTFVVGFVFACYILFQKEGLRRGCRRLLYAFLPREKADQVLEVSSLTYAAFASFLSGQCLEAVILGGMFFLCLSVLGFPYALMISVLIAFTALIPIFGAFIGCAVGAFMILMLDPMEAVWFVVLFLVLQQVEGNLIYPRVVGGSVGLPSIWVLAAVTIGGSTMGVAGMLLFIPLCSVVYTLLCRSVARRLAQRRLDP